MAPSQHLLHVNSCPNTVSSDLWRRWYIEEHLPDLNISKTSDRASFYEEIPTVFTPELHHARPFLALYETSFEEPLKSEEYAKGVRHTSELWKEEGSPSNLNRDNGDFDALVYNLIQDYDPLNRGNTPSPHILTVEMNPSDPDDFEKWYREEHLRLLSKLPGYHRTLRYKLGPATELTKTKPPPYLAIHFVEDVNAFGSKEADAANTTEWTQKHIAESKPFAVRGWKMLGSGEGW